MNDYAELWENMGGTLLFSVTSISPVHMDHPGPK